MQKSTRLWLRWQTWMNVGNDEIEALPGVVPKELTNGELLELEQKYITEEEAREKELQKKEKKNP